MKQYLQDITNKFSQSSAKEMVYRADMENFLKRVFHTDGKVLQINHDSTYDRGNKPDFVIYKNDHPILYIEVKDVGINLDKVEKSEQMARYYGYNNLILTDYLEFRFYRNGIKYCEAIRVGKVNTESKKVESNSENFELLQRTLVDFATSHKEAIRSGKHLSQIMGGRAARIRDNVKDILSSSKSNSDLEKIFDVMKTNLLASLSIEQFADMYAQTLVYGLFVARYHDKSQDDFTRQEARELLPASNPFLRSFFDHISGASFPERLKIIVDELCEIFSHSDIDKLLHDFYGYEKENKDPIIHFYEDFLREYDKQKKIELGVFYTPKEVVQFIVRSIDEILKTEFNLPKGLADTSKVTKKINVLDKKMNPIKIDQEFHKVQILDIATGTGTFLNETVLEIYKNFEGNQGMWNAYVKEHLLPRLHGFELMMASYTIAHLKLGMTLSETGVKDLNRRLGIYLTNTLDEPVDNKLQGTLFGVMESIEEEAREASRVKTELPVMVVIGNPPYSGESMNTQYTGHNVYKVEPGGKIKLKEKNSKWINDDYVKFIRFAESMIEKNGQGIVGMITAHGYIDNPTFRGMRWHLRKTFDKIYIIDLHGNANKREVTSDGSKDENVFDIKTGAAIILGVKTGFKAENELCKVFKVDIQGLRKYKFDLLKKSNVKNLGWIELSANAELWVKEKKGGKEYERGFPVNDIFVQSNTGIVTKRDWICINESIDNLWKIVGDFINLSEGEVRKKYSLPKDGDWSYKNAMVDLKSSGPSKSNIIEVLYRPFDTKFTYYTGKSKGFLARPVEKLTKHLIKENLSLILSRQGGAANYDVYDSVLIANQPSDLNIYRRGGGAIFPLHLYQPDGSKVTNFNPEIVNKIYDIVGNVTPENILDYIYAVLYTPSYREKYKEFLKIDFPRVPYPESREQFMKLAKKGERLRELHLLNATDLEKTKVKYPVDGDNIVEKVRFENEKVYINETQYFEGVPEKAWNFYIGGYQPLQKYLKDRKGRNLSFDEIEHYRKVVYVIEETMKVMEELDNINNRL
jgi:predicted helicase